ncbi:MAG: PAS domain S-box protein, partial [Chloroflexota bacterium]
MNERENRILLVEDNPGDVRLIKENLRDAATEQQFKLTVAGRFDEALRLLDTQTFDVILLDLSLPDTRGLETLKALGARILTLPLIVITGLSDEAVATEAVRMGAQDYLVKNLLTADSVIRSIRYAVERAKVRSELSKRETQYRLLAENITDVITRHGPDSTIRYISPSCRAVLGYEPDEMIGHKVDDFFHPDDLPILDAVRDSSRHQLNTYTISYRIRYKDGTFRWFETAGNVNRDPATGFVTDTVTVSRDISERHAAEEYTRLLQKAVEQTADAIIVMTAAPDLAECRIVFVNPSFSQLTGYSPEALLGQPRRILNDHMSDPVVARKVQAVLAEGKSFRAESVNFDKQGREYAVEWNIAPIRDASGAITHYVCTQRDITERRVEQRARAQLAAIVESSEDAIISKSLDGVIMSWNQAAERLYGYRAEEAIGQSVQMLEPTETSSEFPVWLKQLQQGYRIAPFETVRMSKAGERVDISLTLSPIIDATGAIVGAASISHDISDLKRQAEAVQAAERFARSTLDALSAHIAILDETGTILAVNSAWRQFALANHATSSVSEGANYLTVCDKSANAGLLEAQVTAAGIRAVMRHETPSFDMEYPCHSPTEQRWFVLRVTRFSDDGPIRVVVAHENITERKQAEQSLDKERHLLRTLIDNMPDYIYVKDNQSRIIVSNQANATLLGIETPAEALGKTDFDFFTRQEAEQFFADEQAILQTGQMLLNQAEFVTHQTTGLPIWLETTKVPLRDSSGQVNGIVGIGRDITERKRAEQTLRESEARYRSLFENMLDGFAYHKMEYKNGQPDDYTFLAANHIFETITGLKNVIGRKVSEVIPGIREADPHLFEIYGRVASGGEPLQFESYVKSLGNWFSISVYSPERGYFAVVF